MYECVYTVFFGREITKYTVMYGVYVRFWPTLCVCVCSNAVTTCLLQSVVVKCCPEGPRCLLSPPSCLCAYDRFNVLMHVCACVYVCMQQQQNQVRRRLQRPRSQRSAPQNNSSTSTLGGDSSESVQDGDERQHRHRLNRLQCRLMLSSNLTGTRHPCVSVSNRVHLDAVGLVAGVCICVCVCVYVSVCVPYPCVSVSNRVHLDAVGLVAGVCICGCM